MTADDLRASKHGVGGSFFFFGRGRGGVGSAAQPSAVMKITIRRRFRADFSPCSPYFPQDQHDPGATGAANSLLECV